MPHTYRLPSLWVRRVPFFRLWRGSVLPLWSKLLIRIDGAAFSHDVLDHLQTLTTSRRRVRWVTGWAINATDEQAIALLPENVWTAALRQDGERERDHFFEGAARQPASSSLLNWRGVVRALSGLHQRPG
ncbi:hypothetical protein [Actinacidiphila oryziradicis]|uniref:Uncharacterized protein n=1 Tax=Actinacidiphila oryziradicis TaxID=2571141 RepID=A0A4U0RMF5_9ACTN|nr:hypothetical protein [Actinacidiphila oryziradicis]TJZ96487.1 hypothetical protein FCI23_50950 [Actinacidiphila oryziradicis]